jgi:hypothetical protein
MMAFITRVFGIITVMASLFEVRVTMCAHETRRLRDTLAGVASGHLRLTLPTAHACICLACAISRRTSHPA